MQHWQRLVDRLQGPQPDSENEITAMTLTTYLMNLMILLSNTICQDFFTRGILSLITTTSFLDIMERHRLAYRNFYCARCISFAFSLQAQGQAWNAANGVVMPNGGSGLQLLGRGFYVSVSYTG
jgi:hypothetical protein